MVCKQMLECIEIANRINDCCPECRAETRDTNITRTERGKRYNLKNPSRFQVVVFKMDGGVIRMENGIEKCDFLYIVKAEERRIAIFVELKGRDVRHAIKQLKASMDMYGGNFVKDRVLARIVCKSVPKISNDKDIIDFRKYIKERYGAVLKISETYMDDYPYI